MNVERNTRVIVIDDNDAIHEDFRKILGGGGGESTALHDARAAFLGGAESAVETPQFDLEDARQGEEGLRMVEAAVANGTPYATAFVDVRMPPGMDGIQTIKSLWDVDPNLEVVICTAFADYSLEEIVDELGNTDRLLILKKPFDPAEVRQLASALTEKWNIGRRERLRIVELENVNRELEKATRRAEEASRTKSDFLANMSHEIRTPMTSILGNVELLCDEETGPEERSFYQDLIQSSGEQLMVIVNDILDISKIEAGQMSLVSRAFAPQDIAREVVSLLDSRARERGLVLGLETEGPVPREINGDPIRLRQVLVNLIGNAVKFTDTGSVTLKLSLEGPETGKTKLRFDVVDTGVGIAEEKLPTLFEPFTQVDETSTRERGGTGLGLTIANRLTQLMDAELEVESELGRGSKFSLVLPIEVSSAEQMTSGVAAATPAPAANAESRRARARAIRLDARILVVEDGKLNQMLVATILKRAGARVEVADNGAIGCETFWAAEAASDPFDLILMDMQMPVMDGYTAARQLRDKAHTGPIVALTAHAMSGDREKCIQAGCTDYATKPVDALTLLELCRALLAEFGTRAALPSESKTTAEPRVELRSETDGA